MLASIQRGLKTIPTWAWLLLACALIFGTNLTAYPLFDVDEPRYVQTAVELITRNDWITPHFNDVTRFDKPIFYYWLIAGFYKLFGVSELAGRLVSALSATTIVMTLYAVGRRVINNRTLGWMSACVLMTTTIFVLLGRWAITDMTLACWMSLTCVFLFVALAQPQQTLKPYIWAGVFCGLGLLTKGPVAIVLPGSISVVYLLLAQRNHLMRLLNWRLWGAVALGIVIALPWYLAINAANPKVFFESFFLLHNLQRYTETVSSHAGPWHYYIWVVLLGAFPWSLTFISLFKQGLNQLLTHVCSQNFNKDNGISSTQWVLFGFAWFITTVLFFSVAQTKLLTYILLAFPGLAIIIASGLHHWIENENTLKPKHSLTVVVTIAAVLITLFGLFLLNVFPMTLNSVLSKWPLKDVLLKTIGVESVLMLVGLIWVTVITVLVFNTQQHFKNAFCAAITGCGLVILCFNFVLLPKVAQLLQGDVHSYGLMARGNNVTLATFKLKRPSLVFYSQKHVYFLPAPEGDDNISPATAQDLYFSPQPVYLVARTKDFGKLKEMTDFTVLKQGAYFSLVLPKNPHKLALRRDVNQ